jgi:hypothetical protein
MRAWPVSKREPLQIALDRMQHKLTPSQHAVLSTDWLQLQAQSEANLTLGRR